MVFKLLKKEVLPHEQVVYCKDYQSGLKGIIAIHNTALGPSLGGCRMHPYTTEEEALKDVLNLSRAMSYKAAFSGLQLGGGKSIIIGDPEKQKTPDLFRSFGNFVQSLNGKYIVAQDVGVTDQDLQYVSENTSFVIGKPKDKGGVGSPSTFTAKGVFYGLKSSAEWKLKKSSLKNVRVIIQGIGSVGKELMSLLLKEGAEVMVYDSKQTTLNALKKTHPQVRILSDKEVFTTPCDVFSPCALGGVLNEDTVETLNCSLVAGAANNQLKTPEIAKKLFDKNILYLPDFVINSGGLIYVAAFVDSAYPKPLSWIESKLKNIPSSLISICEASQKLSLSTRDVAFKLAMEKLTQARKNSSEVNALYDYKGLKQNWIKTSQKRPASEQKITKQ